MPSEPNEPDGPPPPATPLCGGASVISEVVEHEFAVALDHDGSAMVVWSEAGQNFGSRLAEDVDTWTRPEPFGPKEPAGSGGSSYIELSAHRIEAVTLGNRDVLVAYARSAEPFMRNAWVSRWSHDAGAWVSDERVQPGGFVSLSGSGASSAVLTSRSGVLSEYQNGTGWTAASATPPPESFLSSVAAHTEGDAMQVSTDLSSYTWSYRAQGASAWSSPSPIPEISVSHGTVFEVSQSVDGKFLLTYSVPRDGFYARHFDPAVGIWEEPARVALPSVRASVYVPWGESSEIQAGNAIVARAVQDESRTDKPDYGIFGADLRWTLYDAQNAQWTDREPFATVYRYTESTGVAQAPKGRFFVIWRVVAPETISYEGDLMGAFVDGVNVGPVHRLHNEFGDEFTHIRLVTGEQHAVIVWRTGSMLQACRFRWDELEE